MQSLLNFEEYIIGLKSELKALQSQTQQLRVKTQEQSQSYEESLEQIPQQVRSTKLNIQDPLNIHLEIREVEVDATTIEEGLSDMFKVNKK
jgi:hypothetical protein